MKIRVKKRNGRLESLNIDKINRYVERAAEGLSDVSASEVALTASISLYDGVTTNEITDALILSARQKIEKEPQYSYLAARLLLHKLYKEVFNENVDSDIFELQYRKSFVTNIKKLVKVGRLHTNILKFDLKRLAEKIVPERDLLFKYMGIQTLYDRYLIKSDNIIETPQAFWMRVAIGLSYNEADGYGSAVEIYDALSRFEYCHSTPTLFNSGTVTPQLSSCYLSTVDDSIDGIFGCMHEQARLSKHAGGLGVDFSNVRSSNAFIKGTSGKSNGVVPWLKVFNDTLVAVNQGGKRPGAGCAYLEVTHLDIEDFIDVKRNTGDDRRRCHDMNTAVWVPDAFMRAVEADSEWVLFNPNATEKRLHDCYGKEFDNILSTIDYSTLSDDDYKRVKAKDLWKKLLLSLKTTGHPWITFKDTSNSRYSDSHAGVVHNSNLCCITGDQLVACDKGIVSVKELYDLQCDNKVVGRVQVENASKMYLPRPNAPIVKIITDEGYSHKVTPDHKVWVKDKGWKTADQLVAGEKLLIQQYEGMWGTNHDPELSFLLGLITGDGTFGSGVCIDLWPDEYEFIPIVEQYVENVIGRYKDKVTVNAAASLTPKFSFSDIKARLSSTILRDILQTLISYGKSNKLQVPDWILKSDRETVSAYLSGLYLTDGTVQGGEVTVSSLSSISIDLLERVQIILSNFGIKSSLCMLHEECDKQMPNGQGGYSEYHCKKSYRLLVTSIQGNKILEEITKLGFYRDNNKYLHNIKKDGYRQKLYCTFSRLEQLPNEDAYCVTVDSLEHSWTVNGMITKNTEILRHTIANTYQDGEITEYGETAVCNLASINLLTHVVVDNTYEPFIDYRWLRRTVRTAIRALDNVIDINFYPIKSAQLSNERYRPIGLGIMGLQDVLYKLGIAYDSDEAIALNHELMEKISYYAIEASVELAEKRGAYPSFDGSLWSKGTLPIDTYKPQTATAIFPTVMDWDSLRTRVAKGMRNGNVLAIAPTATISSIQGCQQSIEPDYSVLWVYSTLSGEFPQINEFFVEDAKRAGIWCQELVDAIKRCDGDLSKIVGEIPEEIKNKFRSVFRLNPMKLIECNAARQRFVDQAISFNLYSDSPSLKLLSDMYFHCWKTGLKTTYYMRSQSASKTEQSTVDSRIEPKLCSITDPTCESCQ